MEREKQNLTRGTKDIIKRAITSLPEEEKRNKFKICSRVSELIEEKYIGPEFDKAYDELTEAEREELEIRESKLLHQSKRMGMDSTNKILEKIDNFFYKYAKISR